MMLYLFVKKIVNCFYIYLLLIHLLAQTNQITTTTSISTTTNTEIENLIEGDNNKPDLPNKISNEVMFLETRLTNSYKMALKEANDPNINTSQQNTNNNNHSNNAHNSNSHNYHHQSQSSNSNHNHINHSLQSHISHVAHNLLATIPKIIKNEFGIDKNMIDTPLSSETYPDEKLIPIQYARTNSEYHIRDIFGHETAYPATNVLSNENYWCSKGNHKKDDIIYWEAEFSELRRVHGTNIIWAYSPERFAIQYSTGGPYKDAIEWRGSMDNKKKTWWELLKSSLKKSQKSFPVRITFQTPFWAKKVRILMKGPINYYFGLYKVEFYAKDWVVLIKKTDGSEECWNVNTEIAREGQLVNIGNCLGALEYSENRELFILTEESELKHYVSGLCVVADQTKRVFLQNCDKANEKGDGRTKFLFNPNGSISNKFDPDECVYVPENKPINLVRPGKAQATNESPDGGHDASMAIDGNDESYWMSYPGTSNVTFTITFNEWISAQYLMIDWKYIAKDFDIYLYSLEKKWSHFVKIKNNISRLNKFTLNQLNVRAIQIRMTQAKSFLLGKAVYGIGNVFLLDGQSVLKTKKCSIISDEEKAFLVDEQYFYNISKKKPYMEAYNILSTSYLKMHKYYILMHRKLVLFPKTKEKAEHINTILIDDSKKLKVLLEKIRLAKITNAVINNDFAEILEKHSIQVINVYNLHLQKGAGVVSTLGNTPDSPALDCYKIKEVTPYKKSGFYWIKPKCAPKALRVYCDFSIKALGKGVSLYVWNNNQVPNTKLINIRIEKVNDVKYQCARLGLAPVLIKNKTTLQRIRHYLILLGYNIRSTKTSIPLGYDYSCDGKKNCAKIWKSFSDVESNPIKNFFNNIEAVEKDLVLIGDNKNNYDTVGFGGEEGNPYFFELAKSNISALVCSTNVYNSEIENPIEIKLNCKDTLKEASNIDNKLYNTVEISCPAHCNLSYAVYGTKTYSDKSSICVAAIHSGVIKEKEGGNFSLTIHSAVSDFVPTFANEVQSKSSSTPSNTTFTVDNLEMDCPINYYKNEKDEDDALSNASSFLELGMSEIEMLRAKSKLESELETLALNKFNNKVKVKAKLKAKSKFRNKNKSKFRNKLELEYKMKELEKELEALKAVSKSKYKDTQTPAAPAAASPAPAVAATPPAPSPTVATAVMIAEALAEVQKKADAAKAEEAKKAEAKKVEEAKTIAQIHQNIDNSLAKNVLALNKSEINKLKDFFDKIEHEKASKEAKLKNIREMFLRNLGHNYTNNSNHTNITINPDILNKHNPNDQKITTSTDKLLAILHKFRENDWMEINHIKDFIVLFKKMRTDVLSTESFAKYPASMSYETFKTKYDKLNIILNKLKYLYNKVRDDNTNRISQTYDAKAILLQKYEGLNSNKNLKLLFFGNIEQFYRIDDNTDSTNLPSKWRFNNNSINGRSNAIVQTSGIISINKYASCLIAREKKYYDFELKTEIMLTSSVGAVAVVFRYLNQFNFYAFEINPKIGEKSLLYYKNGERKVIRTISDGAIILANWFKIIIVVNKNTISINMGESNTCDYNNAQIVFKEIDITFSNGSAGLCTNGNQNFYISELDIKPLVCDTPWESRKDLLTIPNKCTIYEEDYRQKLQDRYKLLNPIDTKGGQPKWDFEHNKYGKLNVISQTSKTLDKSEENEFSCAILNNKFCNGCGIYRVDFQATDDGQIGIVFKYKNKNNYYIFEIGGGDDTNQRYFAIRKKANGKINIVQKITTAQDVPFLTFFGYDKNVWYSVEIEFTEEELINVRIGMIGMTSVLQIFSIKDDDIKYGGVGLCTNGTKGIFTNISLKPHLIPISYSKLPSSVDNSDIIIEGQCNLTSNKKKKAIGSSSNTTSSNICVVNDTPQKRTKYCKETFKVSFFAISKCEENFCDKCCLKTTANPLSYHNCNKDCNKVFRAPIVPVRDSEEWRRICINPVNKVTAYFACEQDFQDEQRVKTCKLDHCRLCCATYDIALLKVISTEANSKCYSECSKKYDKVSPRKFDYEEDTTCSEPLD